MATRLSVRSPDPGATGGLRSRFAQLTHSLATAGGAGLLKRFRHAEPTGAAAPGAAPRETLRDQWLQIRTGLRSASATIDSMDAVYRAELHELKSAQSQACALVDEIWVALRNAALAERVSEYVAVLRQRAAEHETLREQLGEHVREHPNQAMRALVHEASRMAEICAVNVRDAVLVAALQRIIHYLIASYGTIAAHARALGRPEEAALFAEHADSDQQLDAELSALAEREVNPQALGMGELPH